MATVLRRGSSAELVPRRLWQETGHPDHQVLEPTAASYPNGWKLLRATTASGATVGRRMPWSRLVSDGSRRGSRASRTERRATMAGLVGAYRLQFRWSQAKRHLDDLARG